MGSTDDGNLGSVRSLAQRALHAMTGARTVAVQEAVHEIDGLPLTICSDIITVASISAAQELKNDDTVVAKDLISLYRNRDLDYHNKSLHEYFYDVYCKNKYMVEGAKKQGGKGRILIGKGLNCKPRYPVDYAYARGMILMHKPWHKLATHNVLLKDKEKTKQEFKRMIDALELPSSVIAQYICAIKYSNKKRIEIIARGGISQQNTNLANMDDDERELFEEWQHLSERPDDKVNDDLLKRLNVSLGLENDWSIMRRRKEQCSGKDWINYAQEQAFQLNKMDVTSDEELNIPLQSNGRPYTIEDLSEEQQEIVIRSVESIIKFLNNDPDYTPFRATIMGGGGTGKSFIINTIISIVRKMTNANDTVQVAAPTGAAAYNVQGCTLHRLLKVAPKQAEKPLTGEQRDTLFKQLRRLLVLIIDERSQVNSMDLGAAEIHTRQCIFKGQNQTEYWGGLPVVLLFGDDYQLSPVASEGAIAGHHKMNNKQDYGKKKLKNMEASAARQLLTHHGHHLFIHHMTENVYELTRNYRVKSESFKDLLTRLRQGAPTWDDAQEIYKRHVRHHKRKDLSEIIQHPKTMFLYACNVDKDRKNVEMLVAKSKNTGQPVARLQAQWGTNKQQGGRLPSTVKSHFYNMKITHATDICVGARVAIDGYNFLPEIGLYNGAFGTVEEIVYKNRPRGPNDKENNSLPDYVVVDFPHLKLPPSILPWDADHPTVSIFWFKLLNLSHVNISTTKLTIFVSHGTY